MPVAGKLPFGAVLNSIQGEASRASRTDWVGRQILWVPAKDEAPGYIAEEDVTGGRKRYEVNDADVLATDWYVIIPGG